MPGSRQLGSIRSRHRTSRIVAASLPRKSKHGHTWPPPRARARRDCPKSPKSWSCGISSISSSGARHDRPSESSGTKKRDELAPPHEASRKGRGSDPTTSLKKSRVVHHSKFGHPTSATGQLHALPRRSIAVCFTQISGINSRSQALLSRATCGLVQCSDVGWLVNCRIH